MTIDEAIKQAREKAEEQKRKYDAHKKANFTVDFKHKKCLQCAEEHEQLAEWLELLKWYQQGMEDIPSESGVLPKDVYRAGYIKAIDDFVEALIPRLTDAIYPKDVEGMRNLINDVAEQLKKGSVDIEAYEESKSIKVGDVVYANGVQGVVIDIISDDDCYIYDENGCIEVVKFEKINKTGRTVDISHLLEQIRGNE